MMQILSLIKIASGELKPNQNPVLFQGGIFHFIAKVK